MRPQGAHQERTYLGLSEDMKRQLQRVMTSADKGCGRLKPGWRRDALRAAWFLLDAVVRDEEMGVWMARQALNPRRKER